jgi:hypothetical protein
MAEGLVNADGQAVPLDTSEQQFAAAMAAPEPGARPDYPAPPKRDPAAPHGRDTQGNPLAPHGVKADGTPRMVPPGPGRGHKTRDDVARVQKPGSKPTISKPATQAAADPEAVRVRRAGDAQTSLELFSAGASLLAMIRSAKARAAYEAARLADKPQLMKAAAVSNEKATVIQLDAAAAAIHAEPVGASLAQLAERNSWAAIIVDRLSLVNGVASVGMALLPLVYQLTANHAPPEARDNLPPELMQLGVLPPSLLMEKLAAQNAVKMARAQASILAERQEAEAELAQLRGEQVAA